MIWISVDVDGILNVLMVDYYEVYVKGGFGLLIIEGIYIDDGVSQGYVN